MKKAKKLTYKGFWEQMYMKDGSDRFWPHPEKRCSAFELDRIYRTHLPQKSGTKIIEFGCGGSKWLPYFFKAYGYNISGVDYSEEGCKRAISNLQKVGGQGEIICKDFFEIDEIQKESYDVGMSLGVVEHIDRPEEFIGLFAEYLKKGGILVTYVPNFKGIMGSCLKKLNKGLYDVHKIFNLTDLIEYHKNCGLEPVFSSYIEWADFSVLPLEKFSSYTSLLLKNVIYAFNRSKLVFYNKLQLSPQSEYLCAAMIVLARKQ
jgi:SAM-dependent methyltransferase